MRRVPLPASMPRGAGSGATAGSGRGCTAGQCAAAWAHPAAALSVVMLSCQAYSWPGAAPAAAPPLLTVLPLIAVPLLYCCSTRHRWRRKRRRLRMCRVWRRRRAAVHSRWAGLLAATGPPGGATLCCVACLYAGRMRLSSLALPGRLAWSHLCRVSLQHLSCFPPPIPPFFSCSYRGV